MKTIIYLTIEYCLEDLVRLVVSLNLAVVQERLLLAVVYDISSSSLTGATVCL